MADSVRPPVAVRIVRPYDTEEAFLENELETVGKASVILIGAHPRPNGVILRFEVMLASGATALRGEGRVLTHKESAFRGQPGLALRFTRLDSKSKALVDRAAAIREARLLRDASPPSLQPSAYPASLPSLQPSAYPEPQPTARPAADLTARPSAPPSADLTARPSADLTSRPSAPPSAEPEPRLSADPEPRPSAPPSADLTSRLSADSEPQPRPSADLAPPSELPLSREPSRSEGPSAPIATPDPGLARALAASTPPPAQASAEPVADAPARAEPSEHSAPGAPLPSRAPEAADARATAVGHDRESLLARLRARASNMTEEHVARILRFPR